MTSEPQRQPDAAQTTEHAPDLVRELLDRSVKYTPAGSMDEIVLSPKIIRAYIASPSKSGALPNDAECIKFQMFCRAHRLDPFIKDAYLMGYDGRDGTKWETITSYHAMLRRAEEHNDYRGFESGVLVEREGELIERVGQATMDGDRVIGAWARVHREGRIPRHVTVTMREYRQNTPRWSAAPHQMLEKCATAHGHRTAFPSLQGMYDADEIRRLDQATPQMMPPVRISGDPGARLPNSPSQQAADRARSLAMPRVTPEPPDRRPLAGDIDEIVEQVNPDTGEVTDPPDADEALEIEIDAVLGFGKRPVTGAAAKIRDLMREHGRDAVAYVSGWLAEEQIEHVQAVRSADRDRLLRSLRVSLELEEDTDAE